MGLGVAQVPEVLQHLPELARSVLSHGVATGGLPPSCSICCPGAPGQAWTLRHPCTKAPPCGNAVHLREFEFQST